MHEQYLLVLSCWDTLPVILSADAERKTMSNARGTAVAAPMDWGKCGTYGERKKASSEKQQTWRITKLEFADHHSH